MSIIRSIRPLLLPLTLVLMLLAVVLGSRQPGAVSDAEARLGLRSAGFGGDPPAAATVVAGDYRISGPYAHENLSVFLIHGDERVAGRDWLTLQEAMESKALVVHETGSVNELEVENVGDVEIFIQATEIVKGGKQDRALAVDMIVPPKSGRLPIAAFCVEHGRWAQRDGEYAGGFGSSTSSLNSKELRLAAKHAGDQSKVWEAVSSSQAKLAREVGGSVADERSETSLQLTLENADVTRLADAYVAKLSGAFEGRDAVIGYAFAINGEINTADVYGSTGLFRKLWPKMLRAAAVEAVAERGTAATATVTIEDVRAVLAEAEQGAQGSIRAAGAARSTAYETDRTLLFETSDNDTKGWVHRNYVKK